MEDNAGAGVRGGKSGGERRSGRRRSGQRWQDLGVLPWQCTVKRLALFKGARQNAAACQHERKEEKKQGGKGWESWRGNPESVGGRREEEAAADTFGGSAGTNGGKDLGGAGWGLELFFLVMR